MSEPAIYLASTSPRRRQILRLLGIKFRSLRPDFLEPNIKTSNAPKKFAITCALFKALSCLRRHKIKSGLVIGMDTIVVQKNRILGKPANLSEARKILKILSGKMHYVITGVAIIKLPQKCIITGAESTRVKFRPLSFNEINRYIHTPEPFDKAGAYAIQGRASVFIEKINGCYLNVIGLPVPLLFKLLKQIEPEAKLYGDVSRISTRKQASAKLRPLSRTR
ncbi:MAG: nucleoside triphosphate pyrophosphatase [candidate division WOR-3 bacterium]|jgi:septum formation protein|nr:Maf family protein [candidate division WOR-3 bacterium]MDH7518956.1 nucleoside triphosphate pyrophosphatase [bacterium]